MTLSEFARTHDELRNVKFIDTPLSPAPKIIGVFGAFTWRDDPTLNSRNWKLKEQIGPPPVELGLTTTDEMEAWYEEQNPLLSPYRRKILTRLFTEQNVCYIDPCWPIVVADYLSSLDSETRQEVELLYQHFNLNTSRYIKFVEAEYRNGIHNESSSISATLQQRKEFVTDIIARQMLLPLFVENKNKIDQQAVIFILPFGAADFAQYCDKLIYVKESDQEVAAFMQPVDNDMKQIINEHISMCLTHQHTTIDINNLTDQQVVNNVIYNTSL